MNRTTVDSTNLKSIGYDFDKKILEIEFLTKSVYQYMEVPISIYTKLVKSNSKGEFFYHSIRGKFQFKKIK